MTREKKILAVQAFAMYLLTGALILVIGTNLGQYARQFGITLEQAAVFASAFSLGRVSTVYLTGYLTEKLGVQRILGAGVLLILAFLLGISFSTAFAVGCVSSFLGGMGMGAQDACCPVILQDVFPRSYASVMSAGQAFFGAGSFLHPFVTSISLQAGGSYRVGNYLFVLLCAVMLLLLPLAGRTPLGVSGAKTTRPPVERKTAGKQFTLLLAINFVYCAALNTISMFTVAYGQHIGLSEEIAPLILSFYSAGKMVGCILFVIILRRLSEETVLMGNFAVSVVAMGLILTTKNPVLLSVCYFVSGFMLGVLFSIIITFVTRLFPQSPARATAMVAIVGGGADVLAPLMISGLILRLGRGVIVPYSIVMLAASFVFSVWFAKTRKTGEEIPT